MTESPTTLSGERGGSSLQRLVRRLVVILLGERNAKNLYGEDDATKKFEAEAKRIGAAVVAGDLVWPVNLGVKWMVDPLADPKKEQGKKKQYQVALWDGLRVYSNRCNSACSADNREGVPPTFYLQPGECVAHVMVMKSPNARISDAPRETAD